VILPSRVWFRLDLKDVNRQPLKEAREPRVRLTCAGALVG